MDIKQDCPLCFKETTPSIWTEDIVILHCEPCGKRHYYSKKLNRIMDDSEVNKLKKEWQ